MTLYGTLQKATSEEDIKAALMKTEVAIPLLEDKSIEIKWGKSAIDVTTAALDVVSNWNGTHFVSLRIESLELEFIDTVKTPIRSGEIVHPQITPDNLKQVFVNNSYFVGCDRIHEKFPLDRREVHSRLYDIYQAVYSVTATDNLDSVYASLGDFRLILRRQPRALPFKTVANVFGNPTFKSYAEWEYVCQIERNEVLIFFYEGLTGYVGDIDIIYSNDGRMKIGE